MKSDRSGQRSQVAVIDNLIESKVVFSVSEFPVDLDREKMVRSVPEKGLSFSYVVGVSAGSCNLFAYVGKQRGYARACMIQKDRSNSFWGVPQMVESHKFVDLDKVFYDYAEQYDFDFDEFIANPIEWEMVVSNIETGLAEYMHTDDIERSRIIGKASCSMPGLTSPVEIDGQYYLDGGICDSIPIRRAL